MVSEKKSGDHEVIRTQPPGRMNVKNKTKQKQKQNFMAIHQVHCSLDQSGVSTVVVYRHAACTAKTTFLKQLMEMHHPFLSVK